jgi:hypothetical protein
MTERGENGKFAASTDAKMNEWMINQVQNSSGKRLARRLFDADAKARREAQNGDD